MTAASIKRFLVDEAATVAAGAAIASACAEYLRRETGSGTALCLYLEGDLGAGKTTFSRGFVQSLGFQAAVKSPTYTLVEPYEHLTGLPAGSALYHFDLYRLSDPEELEYLGVEDYFAAGNICLLEWPQRGVGFIPAADIHISLAWSGAGRELLCTAASPKASTLLDSLAEQ